MAKVIHTPVVARNGRRAVPVAATQGPGRPVASESDALEQMAGANPTPARPALDAARLKAERDEALRRAQDAEQALAHLQGDLQEARQQATAQGYEAGFERATEEVGQAHEEQTRSLQALLENLTEEQHSLVRQSEDVAVEIAFAATCKLLGRLHGESRLIVPLVKQAIGQLLERTELVVYLCAADHERMQRESQQNRHEWPDVEFRTDGQIQMGGCRIQSRAGSLDARLELQMDELKKLLTRTHRGSSAEAGK